MNKWLVVVDHEKAEFSIELVIDYPTDRSKLVEAKAEPGNWFGSLLYDGDKCVDDVVSDMRFRHECRQNQSVAKRLFAKHRHLSDVEMNANFPGIR